MMTCLWVGFGSAIGSMARYGVGLVADGRGTLVTKPLAFTGGHLFVNAECRFGSFRVKARLPKTLARMALRNVRTSDYALGSPDATSWIAGEDGSGAFTAASWSDDCGATGYLVRYGVAADKRHLSCVTRKTSAEMRSLDAGENYVWSVSAFNEAGFSSPVTVAPRIRNSISNP